MPSLARSLACLVLAGALSTARESLALCYRHPLDSVVINTPYDEKGDIWTLGYHRGVDYGGSWGTAIYAVADGTVVDSFWSSCQGYVVIVAHPDGMFSSYSHTIEGSLVGIGTGVSKGTQIARLGDTGSCLDGAHLHLVLANHIQGYTSPPEVDPYAWIEARLVCNRAPAGSLDTTSTTEIVGWAFDADAGAASIATHLYFNGPAGDAKAVSRPLKADVSRSDLCGQLGSCDHGFWSRTPRSLLDDQPHPVHAYGIDASGGPNTQLANSPRILKGRPPAIARTTVRRRVPSAAAFEAWRFSSFDDAAPLTTDGAKLDAGVPDLGSPLPGSPEIVRADDGTGGLWILDSGVRRAVDPARWRFEPSSAKPLSSAVLAQIPQGADFPTAPLLVFTDGPVYFLLDEPFLPMSEETGVGGAGGGSQPAAGAGGRSSGGGAEQSGYAGNAGNTASGGATGAGPGASDDAGAGSCAVGRLGTSRGLGGLAFATFALTTWLRRRRREHV